MSPDQTHKEALKSKIQLPSCVIWMLQEHILVLLFILVTLKLHLCKKLLKLSGWAACVNSDSQNVDLYFAWASVQERWHLNMWLVQVQKSDRKQDELKESRLKMKKMSFKMRGDVCIFLFGIKIPWYCTVASLDRVWCRRRSWHCRGMSVQQQQKQRD